MRVCLTVLLLACLNLPVLAQDNAALLSFPAKATTDAAEQSAVGDSNNLCNKLFAKTVVAYQELHQKLPPNSPIPTNSALLPFVGLHAEDCGETGIMDLIEKALNAHSGKVAILLPLSRMPRTLAQDLMRGVQDWMQSRGFNPSRLLIWRDTAANRTRLETHLAQLVWQQGVSIIIGGLYQSEAPVLAQWADRLRIPTIILNRRPDGPASRYAFYIGPDYRLLASGLIRYASGRNIKRVAILAPQFSRDEPILTAFQAQAQNFHIQVMGPLIYNPMDYNSIDGIVRKLFHIDDEGRNQELLDLSTKAKEAAAELGVPYDPKSLVLPPIIDVDAIFIADHFKNVRHLSKILAYYGVKRLPLLGVPRWRAFELVNPPDENLVGSVFVDYLGSYKQLPFAIQVPTVDKEYFAEGPVAGSIDLRLVVHHAVYSAFQALVGMHSPRYALYKRLEATSGPRDSFLSGPRVFRSDHSANWPTFLFGVGRGSVSILQTFNPLTNPTRTNLSSP